MATDTPAQLAERLIGIAPAGMSKVLFGNSGSDANDTQVKLVRLYNNVLGRPQKKKIISRWRGYHGVSLASASLTGLASLHADFDLPLDGDPARPRAAPPVGGPARRDRGRLQRAARRRARGADRRRGSGDRGGVHRRADPGGRRRDPAAGGLLRGDPGRAAQARRAADRRRGRLRVRAARHLVRQPAVRPGAGPHDRREGHHLRVRPALGVSGLRARLARAGGRHQRSRLRPRLHVQRPSAGRGRSDGQPRHHRARRPRGPGRRTRRPAPGRVARGVRGPPARGRGPRRRSRRGGRVRRRPRSAAAIRSSRQLLPARRARVPGARRDHARAPGGGHDLVLPAVRDHRGRGRPGRQRRPRGCGRRWRRRSPSVR